MEIILHGVIFPLLVYQRGIQHRQVYLLFMVVFLFLFCLPKRHLLFITCIVCKLYTPTRMSFSGQISNKLRNGISGSIIIQKSNNTYLPNGDATIICLNCFYFIFKTFKHLYQSNVWIFKKKKKWKYVAF